MKEDIKGISIRFPMALFKAVKKRAKENHRSINNEVLVSIERYIELDEARASILARNRGKADE